MMMRAPALPPATAFRPWQLRMMMGALGAAWKRGLLPPPSLDPERLRAVAQRETGLRAEDPDQAFFDRQLAVLLPALETEAGLSQFGRLVAEGTLLKILKERLQFSWLMAAYPEIDRIELAPPIVVMGQMRSGTTRLQRLLACDPQFTALRLFEASCPVPGPDAVAARRNGRPDPRLLRTARMLWFISSINPGIQSAHPAGALEVDEELGLLEQSLAGALIEAQRRVPAFARHCETRDQTPAYRRMARLLKLRCWFADVDPARPHVLKTPQYMQDLPALLTVFPGARLIFLDRDPVEVVASGASLIWNQMVIQSDHVDPHWIGREWLYKTAHRAHAARTARASLPPAQQLDIGYADMNRDWRRAIERVYAFLGRELRGDVLAAMEAYLDRARREHGYMRHRYRLEDFGLTDGDVRALLADDVRADLRPAA
jgi:hypothetical protein